MFDKPLHPIERDLIKQIAERAAKQLGVDRLDTAMDVTATHETNPLQLYRLLNADDINFAHDIYGIRNHLNRATGYLMDCFYPRCSA